DANRFLPRFKSTAAVHDVAGQWSVPATDAEGRVRRERTHQYLIDQAGHPDQPTRAVFRLRQPIELAAGESLTVTVKGASEVPIRVGLSPIAWLRPFDPQAAEALAVASGMGDPNVAVAWLLQHSKATEVENAVNDLVSRYQACRDGRALTMVSRAVQPLEMRVLPRGNWQDKTGPIVQPATPEFLGRFGEGDQEDESESRKRLTRIDLAHWLVHPDNPLTSRVVVNRLWKQFFGTGLSASVDDLGAQGESPSHPKLLDYLASELVDSGWDLQHVIRLMLNSRAYAQDSRVRPELSDSDPDNRLLAFHPPKRLEAEAIRDNALSIAGLLNLEIGGPPVKPYQPPGYYANLQFPNREYQASSDQQQYRRGLYMHWQRTFLHPMLANFDAPSREDCVALRTMANTPQQALTLLNDPSFVEAAGHFAWLALTQATASGPSSDAVRSKSDLELDDRDRIAWMIRRTLQRPGEGDELQRLQSFLQNQRRSFRQSPHLVQELIAVGQAARDLDWNRIPGTGYDITSAQVEWAAWTAMARVLLNLHETITRY
ncbi:MAG: DUF1553 domain-containing protein, partial [Planctomycetota bacterium]